MRLSESLSNLIASGAEFLTEAEQKEAEYISELREAVLKKAERENFSEDAKERVWLAVYVDPNGEPEVVE